MKYEKTPIKPTNPKKVILNDMGHLTTPTILWYVVKRHKFGLLSSWAVIITVLYLFPALPHILSSVL